MLAVAALALSGCATQEAAVPESVQSYYDQHVANRQSDIAQPAKTENLAPLKAAIAADAPVTVYALGSSVGVGATLPDAGTQAPSAYLTGALGPLTAGGATLTNLSVNGSVASEGVAIYREQVKPHKPTVLLLAYGMNDGNTPAYNAGQTFPGAMKAMREIISEARADGITVLVATTPSPHMGRSDFGMPEGMPVVYPAGGVALPKEAAVEVNGVPFSARHNDFNKGVTDLAAELQVELLDVVPSWTAAVAAQGEDSLFNAQEAVHPNLAGHTASYWAAVDTFTTELR